MSVRDSGPAVCSSFVSSTSLSRFIDSRAASALCSFLCSELLFLSCTTVRRRMRLHRVLNVNSHTHTHTTFFFFN